MRALLHTYDNFYSLFNLWVLDHYQYRQVIACRFCPKWIIIDQYRQVIACCFWPKWTIIDQHRHMTMNVRRKDKFDSFEPLTGQMNFNSDIQPTKPDELRF